ncbi:MAG TPA: CHAT domain-containing protein, partial [Acidobacteriota bacterium]|nr:CHAT domain-containing protein [Acidobacteriota bacterium]
QFARLETRRRQMPGDGLIASITCSSAPLEHELDKIRAQIALQAHLDSQNPSQAPLDWDAIEREVLDDEEVLVLYYSLGQGADHVWLLGADLFESKRLEGSDDVGALVDRFHRELDPHDRPAKSFPADALGSLSRILLDPVREHLDSKSVVVVVADGALSRIPFSLLPDPSTLSEASPRSLMKSHAVISVPSLSTWRVLRRRSTRKRPRDKRIAVVGDPVYNRSDDRLSSREGLSAEASGGGGGADRHVLSQRLHRLPAAGRETQAIVTIAANSAGSKKGIFEATGLRANRDLFLSGQIDDYPILHIAGHADIHPLYPEFSHFVLAAFDGSGKPINPYLRVYEIARLRLSADLVVLSACRSGAGLTYRGEGVVGLTQGFFAAGARQAVVSLWDVDDEATKDLMTYFYRNLFEKGESAVQALRHAQLEMARHPQWGHDAFFFAGFMVQGDWK